MAPKRHPHVIHHPGAAEGTTWVAFPLDDDWDAYAHLVAQDGHPVIAELRILPAPKGDSSYGLITAVLHDATLGGAVADEPSFELPPDSVPAEPPEGGLTARVLRRIHLRVAVEFAYEVLREWLEDEAGSMARNLSASGFRSDAVKAPRRPGRRGRDDYFYATVAAAYVDALRRGSRRPVVDAAQTLSQARGGVFEPAYVRDLLYAARGRGLLTRPPKGRAGGELTERALAALRQHRKEH